ncbi:MAG: 2-oxoacid:acceptor oxidoreductase family protein [Armatimonadota bacterium]|nr:2-oxoacid:acceptor oxidoreductase family protein [Armatimonadota bacterium]MDW8156981.1 2-oxoacid:acceptor oxidoreductase family protein [Armatimonadota bacterium]
MEFVPLEIRWHGRGGYGAKTAALLLAEAVIEFGGFAQASPEFGPERRGAPVQAYTRIAPQPVRRRGAVDRPDVLVLLDARLVSSPGVLDGATDRTHVVVNAPEPVAVPGVPAERVRVLDASGIAGRTLGREIPNVVMLAAVAVAFVGLPPGAFLRWLEERLARELPEDMARRNAEAARLAVEEVLPWLRGGRLLTVGR